MAEGISVTYDIDSHQLGAEARAQGLTVAYDSDGLSAKYTNGGLTLAYDGDGLSGSYTNGQLHAAYDDGRLTGSYGAIQYNNGQWGIDPNGIRGMLASAGTTYVNELVNKYSSEYALPGQFNFGINANGQITGSYGIGGLTFGSNGSVSGNIGSDTPFGALGLNVQDGNVTAGMATDYGNIGIDSHGKPTGSIAAGPLGLGIHDGQLTGQTSIGPINMDYTEGQWGGGMALGGSNIGYEHGNWSGTVEGNFLEQGLGETGLDTSGFEITDVAYDANTGWTGAFSNEFGTINQDGKYSATVIPDDGDESSTWEAAQETAANVTGTVSDWWTSIFGGEKPAETPGQPAVVENTERPSGEPASEDKETAEAPKYQTKESATYTNNFEIAYQQGSGDITAVNVVFGALKIPAKVVAQHEGISSARVEFSLGGGKAQAVIARSSGIYGGNQMQEVLELFLPAFGTGEMVKVTDGALLRADAKGALSVMPGGMAPPEPKVTVFVNGAVNHEMDCLENLRAAQLGANNGQPMYAVYNDRKTIQAGLRATRPAEDTLTNLLMSGKTERIVAHSLGGATSARAIGTALRMGKDLSSLKWITMAGYQDAEDTSWMRLVGDGARRVPRLVYMGVGANDTVTGVRLSRNRRNYPEAKCVGIFCRDANARMYVEALSRGVTAVNRNLVCADGRHHSFAQCYAGWFGEIAK